jgi:hypothetical protein
VIGRDGRRHSKKSMNQTTYLLVEIAHLYMKQHHLTPKKFLKMDKKYGILDFLETGYEPFHLTGSRGILHEVEDYIAIQSADTKDPPASP